MREVPGAGGHADDGTAGRLAPVDTLPGTGGHQRRAVLDAEERADQVQVDGRPDAVEVGLGDGAHGVRTAGIGEQDVEVPARPGGRGHGCSDLLLHGHVGDDVAGRSHGEPLGGRRRGNHLELGDGGGQLVLGASADRHVGAVAHQAGGGSEADPAASTRHQCGEAGDAGRCCRAFGH